MPFPACRPLSSSEVDQVLKGIADPPAGITKDVALEAMTVTAASMSSWCAPFAGLAVHERRWDTIRLT